MVKETTEGKKRVCWNSWIAPHNLEGFFLNMGDMLVKSGDWQTAQKIYANARLLKTYATWRYQSVLEDRINRAQANVALLNAQRWHTEGTDDDQLGILLHGLPSAVRRERLRTDPLRVGKGALPPFARVLARRAGNQLHFHRFSFLEGPDG